MQSINLSAKNIKQLDREKVGAWLAALLIGVVGILLRLLVPTASQVSAFSQVAGLALALLGGTVFFFFVRRLTSTAGGLFALAYYALLPLWIANSQVPSGPLLGLTGLILALWSTLNWLERRNNVHAVIAAVFLVQTGLAWPSFIPVQAAFVVGCLMGAGQGRLKILRSPWYWLLLLAALLPAAVPLLTGSGDLSSARLLISPKYYFAWTGLLHKSFDLWLVFLGLWGLFLWPARQRWVPLSLWAGYILQGILMPAAITTSPELSLSLVLIIGLSLAPLAGLLLEEGKHLHESWRLVFIFTLVMIFLLSAAFAYHEALTSPFLSTLVRGVL